MQAAEALYRLQTLDLRVETLQQALRAAEHQLGESPELKAARTAVAEQSRAVHGAELRQRDLEFELARVETHLRAVEGKLYGGRVLNPKELQSWERDAGQLRAQKSRLEDELLTVMEEVETGRAALRAAERQLGETEAAWRAAQAELQEQIARLRAELAEVQRERTAHAATISEAHRALYERLRRERAGRAVARVEQSTCQGCRLSLPAALVQRARVGPDVVFCSSCGRILWASR